MLNKISQILGSFLLFVGMMLFLVNYNVIVFKVESLITLVTALISLLFFYHYYGSEKKVTSFISVLTFFLSILVFIKSQYNIVLENTVILSTIIFCIGIWFLLIYFENLKNHGFLLISLFITASSLILLFYNFESLKYSLFKTSFLRLNFFSYWSILFVIIGISILWKKKK